MKVFPSMKYKQKLNPNKDQLMYDSQTHKLLNEMKKYFEEETYGFGINTKE